MADTNEMLEVRQGLIQFIGAMMNRISFKGADSRQVMCAILLEEALKLITVNERYELFSAKPILRGTIAILNQRINEYTEALDDTDLPLEVRDNIVRARRDLNSVMNTLKNLVERSKKEGIES